MTLTERPKSRGITRFYTSDGPRNGYTLICPIEIAMVCQEELMNLKDIKKLLAGV